MLSKCANPGCPATFLYLHQGKLFRLESATEDPASQAARKPARHIEFFWLCDECASGLTLSYNREGGITVVPSQKMPARAASVPGAAAGSGSSVPQPRASGTM
jgi:hypothetical protein